MILRTPTPQVIAIRQLNEAQVSLLEAYMALETAQARVNALRSRIERLEGYVEEVQVTHKKQEAKPEVSKYPNGKVPL